MTVGVETATTDPGELARRAAEASGVRVTLLEDMPSLEEVDRLFVEIWNPDTDEPVLSSHVMRALAHTGGYVAGAHDLSAPGQPLVGASVGFFGPPQTALLHSHISGVGPRAAGRHVGLALKLHQYSWAMTHGVGTITWTFDPLVRRNAYFNIAKLGVPVAAYLPDFYGDMVDSINAGQGSDRLYMSWDVRPELEPGRRDERPAGAVVVLDEGPDGRPVAHPAPSGTTEWLVRVPADIEAVRRADPEAARSWRGAVRDVLGGLLGSGGRVTGFTRDGCYVVTGGERKGAS